MAYYSDSSSLSTSTSIYQDANLTIYAPDGYYSDQTISRYQSLGILQPAEACANCEGPVDTSRLDWRLNGVAGGRLKITDGNSAVILDINSISGEIQSGVLYLTPTAASSVTFLGDNIGAYPLRFRVCDITNGVELFYSGDITSGNFQYAPPTGGYNLSLHTSVNLAVNAIPLECPVA